MRATTTSSTSDERAPARRPAWQRHGPAMMGCVALGIVSYFLLTNLTGQLGQVALLVAVWTLAVTGLNIVQGLAGYPSLAQASFYGGGAYISTILLHRGVPMIASAILAVLLVAFGGLMVGLIFGRTRGQYFAIGTLFFAAVVTLVLNIQTPGGPNGLPVDLGFSPDTTLRLLAVSVSVGFAIFYILRRSWLGLRLLSIREDEDLADHVGVPTAQAKLIGLVLSAVFGAWAGMLLAQYNGVIAPSEFTFGQGFLMFVAIGIGGYGRLLAPLVGSLIVIGVPQLLDVGPGVSQIVVGIIFICVMLLVPGGIIGACESAVRRLPAVGVSKKPAR